jgi:hypothetical protein
MTETDYSETEAQEVQNDIIVIVKVVLIIALIMVIIALFVGVF